MGAYGQTVTTHRMMVALVSAALAVAGCSTSASPASPASKAPPTGSPTPSPQKTSAFCLDLSTFNIGVLSYRADAGKAIQGEPLDFKELRRKAKLVASSGERMRASAPPDIAEQFEVVLDAVAESARGLKVGGSARKVVDPLYGEKNRAAFDAVSKYECK